MSRQADLLVLGAGIVGVGVALAAQEAGLSVVLVDRDAPGQGTSFGNAGLIERHPSPAFASPRDPASLLRAAAGRRAGVRLRPAALLPMAAWLAAYWRASAPAPLAHAHAALRALAQGAADHHLAWSREAGGEGVKTGGVLEYLNPRDAAADIAVAKATGTKVQSLTRADLAAREPALAWAADDAERVGLYWPDSAWTAEPGALAAAYAALFQARGGTFVQADAMRLERRGGGGFRLPDGPCADRAVAALGPWSGPLLARFGYAPPLAAKRGYSRDFALPQAASRPAQPVILSDLAVVLSPSPRGVRLISGIEIAPPGAPPNPEQMNAAVRAAATLYPSLAEAEPGPLWMGSRPCTPDMLPIIGPVPGVPGLICAAGHNHWGLTLGPATGKLVAALLTGADPELDPAPYDPARFVRRG